MRRAAWLAFVLALVAGTAGADGEKIVYHGPAVTLTTAGSSFFANGISLGNTVASPYANLYGDAAETLAMRNGGTAGAKVPQIFHIYNFCDGAACATGYERGEITWAATVNVLTIRTVSAGTGSNRQVRIIPAGGAGVDFAANAMQPTTTDAVAIGYSGGQFTNVFISRSTQGGKAKSLTDAAGAVAYATIAVPTNGQIAGEMIWTATSSAAAVRFVANGSIRFWGVDEGGTPVCGINAIGTPGEGHSSGANTLVCTWSNVVATTNCAISVTCTNDTAGVDPITVYGRFNMPTTATITFN